jgi:hypothetical protein
MRLTLKDYETYDKIISDNEDELLQQRLDNFGLQDYRGWFSDTDTRYIYSIVHKVTDTSLLD